MSKRKVNPTIERERQATTEEELRAKWKDHPSGFVQSILKLRQRKARGAKSHTLDDINREVARRRYGDGAR